MISAPVSTAPARMLPRVALIFSIIVFILWCGYKLYDTSPNNLKILARVNVSPDISLDLIAITKPGDPPLKQATSLSFLDENVPKFIKKLKYSWVETALHKFHNRHSEILYKGKTTTNTVTCFFLLRCKGLNNISGYVPVRQASEAMKKLQKAGGGYLLSDAFSFYQGIQGTDLQETDETPWGTAKPVVLYGQLKLDDMPKKDVNLFIGDTITMQYPKGARHLYNLPNPFYREAVPLNNPQPLPASQTHDGVTVTIRDFISPMDSLPEEHLQRLAFLDRGRIGNFPPADNAFNFTGLLTQIHQQVDQQEWIIHTVEFTAGESNVPLQMDPDSTFLNFDQDADGLIEFHSFQGTPDYLKQPVKVSITLRRIARFSPQETQTMDLPLPFPKNDALSAPLGPEKLPPTVLAQLSFYWEKDIRQYRDKNYLLVTTKNTWPGQECLDPVLTRADGSSISLEPYCFARNPTAVYYDIFRANYPEAQPPGLNLDDFTTITLGRSKKVLHPKKFEFVLQPRKPRL